MSIQVICAIDKSSHVMLLLLHSVFKSAYGRIVIFI